ncbi:hypothetical protein PAE1420 [Pyrobaculum aerophilum str. IM2]|uniref:Uncharacterized protein n=1 Tax=Pyrobaculum aerophilum (strain ATCC 51768 / DSM 7523 / JCM 9630 / CIP 104966 / NBRC 100827 / IM2) TaxID=178306 RepID=Q8ZX76_PYRAE|nr:hypothetical protein PAE1420 [Pyrobaculum aerophilum str. IM2]
MVLEDYRAYLLILYKILKWRDMSELNVIQGLERGDVYNGCYP